MAVPSSAAVDKEAVEVHAVARPQTNLHQVPVMEAYLAEVAADRASRPTKYFTRVLTVEMEPFASFGEQVVASQVQMWMTWLV
jgi:hypothetical protein